MTDRQILLNLITSMGLADHMGDVADDVFKALDLIGIKPPADEVGDLSDLMTWLARNHGTTTVWGTAVLDDEEAA